MMVIPRAPCITSITAHVVALLRPALKTLIVHPRTEETRTEQTTDAPRELGDEKVGEDLVVALDSGSVDVQLPLVDVQLPLVAKTSHTET